MTIPEIEIIEGGRQGKMKSRMLDRETKDKGTRHSREITIHWREPTSVPSTVLESFPKTFN
jgi:hypothetical protein